jgi:hypothetical protein
MMNEKLDKRFLTLGVIVLLAALSRVLTQGLIPNVAPIGALALFSGAYFMDRKLAFLIPMAAMLISDIFLGFHPTILFVYAGFALTVMMGFMLRNNNNVGKTMMVTILSSLIFFFLTNFGVWAMYDFYSNNFSGLVSSYIAGIPFLRNSLLGDLFYTGLFFGAFEWMKRMVPSFNVSLK